MSESKVTKLKKITAKDVMGVERFQKPETATHLFTVYGACDSSRVKGTQYNDGQFVLSGRFKAVRNDGEVFESLELYLPEPFQTKIGERVQPNKETGEVPPAIEFAFLIGIAPSKKGALGYTWTCEPMMDEKTVDALANVERLIAGKIPKALPKPEEKPAKK
jgi:hypothetical protein